MGNLQLKRVPSYSATSETAMTYVASTVSSFTGAMLRSTRSFDRQGHSEGAPAILYLLIPHGLIGQLRVGSRYGPRIAASNVPHSRHLNASPMMKHRSVKARIPGETSFVYSGNHLHAHRGHTRCKTRINAPIGNRSCDAQPRVPTSKGNAVPDGYHPGRDLAPRRVRGAGPIGDARGGHAGPETGGLDALFSNSGRGNRRVPSRLTVKKDGSPRRWPHPRHNPEGSAGR